MNPRRYSSAACLSLVEERVGQDHLLGAAGWFPGDARPCFAGFSAAVSERALAERAAKRCGLYPEDEELADRRWLAPRHPDKRGTWRHMNGDLGTAGFWAGLEVWTRISPRNPR